MAVDDKTFRHRVFNADGSLAGEWTDLANDPPFKLDINNILSSMEFEFARNELSEEAAAEVLLLAEDDDTLTDESDVALALDQSLVGGLGPGSNLDLNLDYKLTAYWGSFVDLVTESDEVITTEDDINLSVEDGAPQGRDIFTGYISRWEAEFGGNDNVAATVLAHSNELNNIMLTTDDVQVLDANVDTSYGLDAGPPYAYAQTFTMPSTATIGRIDIPMSNYGAADVQYELQIWSGTDPSTGTLLASGRATVTPTGGSSTFQIISFLMETPVSLTNATSYHMRFVRLGVNSCYIGTRTTAYSGGALYVNDGGWVATGYDAAFELWTLGGDTTVSYLSTDPAYMLKKVLDVASNRGSRIGYDAESIDPTGTVVSYTFKAVTIKEAIDKILELCPADWYFYFDPATNLIHLHQRPDTPDHVLTLGKEMIDLKLRRSMEKIVNDVYFVGGGDPALYVHREDTGSRSEWRRGLEKRSDNRVTLTATAQTLADAAIDRNREPFYSGEGRLYGVDTTIEDYDIGELITFAGFGNMVDELELQIVSKTYKYEYLEVVLGELLPKVPKRIEDIRRNLDVVETESVPATPS